MGVVTTALIGAEALGPSGEHCHVQCRNQLLDESFSRFMVSVQLSFLEQGVGYSEPPE